MQPKILGLAVLSPRVEALSFLGEKLAVREPVRWEHYQSVDEFRLAESNATTCVSGVILDLDLELSLSQDHKDYLRSRVERFYPVFRLQLVEHIGSVSTQAEHRWRAFLDAVRIKKLRDQRVHPRTRAFVPTTVELASGRVDCFTADLSLGGAFLVSLTPPAAGQNVRLRVQGVPEPVMARVVWSRPLKARSNQMPGFGVQFEWSASQQQRLAPNLLTPMESQE
jgi:hypothetical protein